MDSKQFVAKLAQENEALFQASEMNVEAYFASNPSQEALVEHFTGRMVNERMNMVEIATKVANAPASTSTEELTLHLWKVACTHNDITWLSAFIIH